jgi:hypothetical protein
MKDTENLKGLAFRIKDDKVREDCIEENSLAREIGAAVTAAGKLGHLVESFEKFGDDTVCRLDTLPVQ